MQHLVHAGTDVLLPDMGVVHVLETLESGAAIVLDVNGVRWIVGKDMMKNAEICLFAR